MEDKRKQFSADEFVNNEETPVETRNGYKVTIYCTDTNSVYCVRGAICINKDNLVNTWMPNGKYQSNNPIDKFDLFFSRKKTTRRMTCQELSRWLRDHPEEYREYTIKGVFCVYSSYNYPENEAQIGCGGDILIRSNGGEWREPLIEVKEGNYD